jgi:cell wall-associated NlpC family hydrolase
VILKLSSKKLLCVGAVLVFVTVGPGQAEASVEHGPAATATDGSPQPLVTDTGDASEPQTVVVSAAAVTASVERDTFSVTAPPPAAMVGSARYASLTSTWSGGPAPAQAYSGSAVVEYAKQFVGVVPYGSGNSPTTSFSCDGLTQYVFKQFGINLPRGVSAQAALGTRISAADAQAGDLVVWPGRHIGIYAGGGMMVDSPRAGFFVKYRAVWGSPVYLRLV